MSEQDIDKRNDDVAESEVAADEAAENDVSLPVTDDGAETVTGNETTDDVAENHVVKADVPTDDTSADAAAETTADSAADDNNADETDDVATDDEADETDDEAEPQPVEFSVVYDEDDTDDAPIAFAIDGAVDAVDTDDVDADDTDVDIDVADNTVVTDDDAAISETGAAGTTADEAEDSTAASSSETAQRDDAGETGDADETEADAVPRETSAAATAANAKRVNETLALNATAKPSIDATADPNEVKASMTRSERALDQQVGDRVLLKSYPTFSLNHVTTTNRKTGRHVLDNVSIACYAGSLAAIRVLPDEDDPEQRVTLMEVLGGYLIPTSGTAMTKSSNLAELEITELRGHRLGIIPQLYAVRGDLDAESNVRYAMDASGRTYLKPKPVIARELLDRVGFGEATSGKPLHAMPLVEQRRVAIARAISCEADVVIADEPTKGLDADDAREILALLASIAHARDPKRLVIIVTASDEVADIADQVFHLAD